jgi:hypothetical protein
VREALTEVEAGVVALAERALFGLGDGELCEGIGRIESLMARLAAVAAGLVREAEGRELPTRRGYPSAAAWLREEFRLSPGRARRLLGLGRILDERPVLREAAVAGRVGDEQAVVIGDALDSLRGHVEAALVDKAEAALVDHAAEFPPAALARLGERILAHVAPEVADEQLAAQMEREEKRARQQRSLTLVAERGTGRTRVVGWLQADAAAIVSAALDPLSKPRPAADGVRDSRTAPQRRADALVEACQIALAAGDLPQSGGERPQLTVTVAYDILARQLGAGVLNTGQQLSPQAVRRLACDAQIVPAVLGGRSEVLDLGRASRTWTGAARRAIVLRDGGCAFPGCDRPPRWCDVHHIIFWTLGGRTDLTNGVLLCGFHHDLIHHGDWRVRMGADGLPDFIPPIDIDPLQRPRRNHYHRRP